MAIVLAAHGAGDGSSVNEAVRERARSLAESGCGEVAVAFHKGSPGFSSVLSTLRSRVVVVVPLMTSRGYYADVVLPRGLDSDPAFVGKTVRVSMPLGLHPSVAGLVERRIEVLSQRYSLDAPAVAIVGHGTRRHSKSRVSSFELVSTLSGSRSFGPVSAYFLDDEPPVEEVAGFAADRDLLVVPFLIASGLHVREDLTARLGVGETSDEVPLDVRSGGRRIVIDRPVGEDPALDALIEELAGVGPPSCARRG